MSDTAPEPKHPWRQVYLLGILGFTLFPLLVAVVGARVLAATWGTAFLLVLLLWLAVGVGCGVPVFIAARRQARGSDARFYGTIHAVIGSIVGLFAALFAAFAAGMAGAHGRPLRKHGRPVSAPAAPGGAWTGGARPALEGLDPALREVLAADWLHDARMEHAAVAAFGQLSMDLLAVAAPAGLVERCHRAAIEEVEHARQAFALAGAYAGRAVGPGLFPEAAEAGSPSSPERARARLAVEALVDGCVGEGAAAAALAEAAAACADPAVAEVLRVTAREETDHAELSWDVLAWTVETGGAEVEREARRALEALEVPKEAPPRWPTALGEALAARGRLPAARERAIRAEVIAATWARYARLFGGGGDLPRRRA